MHMLSALHLSGRLHDFWMGYRYRTGLSGESTSEGGVERAGHAKAGGAECSLRFYACLRFWFTMSLFIVGLVWVTSNTGLEKSRRQLVAKVCSEKVADSRLPSASIACLCVVT